jgi:tRNA(Ile)-lysidine synthase
MNEIDIAELMAPLGPFERPPSVAVAVSGGSDSMGLGLLLAEWVTAQSGRLHVLTVDHGLRPEAAGECAQVAQIFAAIPGCSAHILKWDGEKPASGIQAAARKARYRLLTDWCRARGVLHRAIAHTADDQAETLAMRGAHRSGVAGLAGMAAVRPADGVRLLRPLLSVRRETIRAWLQARGQGWLDDPSNEATKFERVRVRQDLSSDQKERALELAAQLGSARDEFEHAAARLLCEAGQAHEAGYVSIDLDALLDVDSETRNTALRQVMLAVSGADYAPDLDDVLVSLGTTGQVTPRTLGGCFIQNLKGRFHVFREAAGIGAPIPVVPGWTGPWDNRFDLQVSKDPSPAEGWAVGPLGENGLRQAVNRFGIRLKRHAIPLPARLALPALWHGEHLVSQPHLKLGQGLAARASPRHTVTTCGFTVAVGRPHTIYSSLPC